MRKSIALLFLIIGLLTVVTLITVSASADASPVYQVRVKGTLFDLVWSPDGQLIAVATSEGIQILTKSLQVVTTLHAHEDIVLSVTWNPDGSQLASAGGRDNDSVQIWNYDAATGLFQHERGFSIDASVIIAIEWSPDGEQLAVLPLLSGERTRSGIVSDLAIWDANNWHPINLRHYYTHDPGCSLAWSPDSHLIAKQGDGRIHVFNIETPENGYFHDFNYALFDGYCPHALAWSSKDELAISLNGLQIFDGSSGQILSQWNHYSTWRPEWSPDGENLLVFTSSAAQGILDVDTGIVLTEFKPQSLLWSVDWSPDGSRIVTGSRIATDSQNGIIEIWDVSNLPDTSGIPTLTPLPTYTPTATPSP